jgi:hypothetical protein
MGLLDDAIREHLDLKRKHGAARDDVERLEKEAFGPPTRPGDPDFEQGEGEADLEAGGQAAAEVAEPPSEEQEATGGGFFDGADEFADEPAESPEAGAATEEPPSAEYPAPGDEVVEEEWDRTGEEDWSEHEVVAGEPESEEAVSPAEAARREHAELGDTVDHPALPEAGEPESGEERRAEPEPAETAIFGEGAEDEEDMLGDIDFDLDLGEEPAGAEETPVAERPEPAAERPGEPTTAERPAAAPLEEEDYSGSEGDEEGYLEGDEEGFEGDDVTEDELEDEDEDLLEETPEFLEDTPEGERLWFEQGEPRDFDFDD